MALKKSISVSVLSAALWAASLGVSVHLPAAAQTVRHLPDFTDLVEQVGPSVVNIRTLEKSATRETTGSGPDDEMQEFFRRFFGVPMPLPNNPNTPRQQRPNRGQPDEPQPRGVGSGFICRRMVLS